MTTTEAATTPAAVSGVEFCEAFSIGRTTFYREVSAGLIKAVKCRGRTLIPYEETQAYLRRLGYDPDA